MNPIKLGRTLLKCCTGLVLVILLSACGSNGDGSSTPSPTPSPTPTPTPTSTPVPTPTPTPTSTGVSFAAKIQPIFNAHCISCHTKTGIAGNVLWLDSGAYTNLVNRPSVTIGSTGTLVIPGDSANSILYQRVSGIGLPNFLERMPLGGPFLSTSDQTLLKSWIDDGAINN